MTEVIHREAAKAGLKNDIKFKSCKPSINQQSSSELVCSLNENNISQHDSEANGFTSNLKQDHDVSKTSQLLSDQYLPSNSKPLEAPVENSSFSCSRKSAVEVDTRSAVDKDTLSRYSPSEWHLHNQALSKEAKEQIDNSKNIACNTRLAENNIFNQLDKNRLRTEIHMKERACNVFNWKRILENNTKETIDELDKVQNTLEQLVKSNHAVTLIKNINHDIFKVRNERLEVDLVHDLAFEEIMKEGALCKDILDLYSRIIDEGKKHVQELKDAKQKLEQDWSDKKNTYHIETECIGLKSGSPTVHWKPGSPQLPDRQDHLTGYEYMVRDDIAFNQDAITRAKIFRKNTKEMVKKIVRSLKCQAGKVDSALMTRNYETHEACQHLKNDLIECLKSISNSEATISKTFESIRKLDGPMECAQTKLHMRSQNQDVEQCCDFTQLSLIDEVKGISAGVSTLNSQTKYAEMTLEELKKLRSKLQREILIKQKTIWVDQDMCQHMRSYYPSDQDLHGH